MKIPEIKFTERFKEFMTQNNLTIRQVEQETEIPNQTLSAWLTGTRIPNAYLHFSRLHGLFGRLSFG